MRSAIDVACPLLRELLSHLACERGLAVNTLWAYRRDLEDCLGFLTGRGKSFVSSTSSGLAGWEDYSAYLQSLSLAGKKNRTVRRRFVSLRVLLRFMEGKGIGAASVLERIDKPKRERPLPKALSIEQTNQVIAAGSTSARDRAIFETLYACGLRASELCSLRLADVNLARRNLRAIGKGSKEREVPMTAAAAAAIAAYIDERCKAGQTPASQARLFVAASGKGLCRGRLNRMVRAAGERAGLKRPIGPHTLRHCFASHLLGGGADLRVVQELLGHADVATTEIYLKVDGTRLKGTHLRCHPRA